MEQLIHQLKLTEYVTLTGKVADLKPYYQACDMVVIPSLSEGIPITLQEALAFGKPVVCSRLQGTYAFAGHLSAITWTGVADSEDLARGMQRAVYPLVGAPLLQAKDFIDRYDWSKVAEDYLEAYQAAINLRKIK